MNGPDFSPSTDYYHATLSNTAFAQGDQAPTIFRPRFAPRNLIIVNEATNPAHIIEISFDGSNVHGRLVPGAPSARLTLHRACKAIYFRALAGTPAVSVIAEA